ncbi:heavy metal-binding domain-containing protein [Paracnuella aquatica]|uniref:heavy metal-binding domain-containing protein n=1 Tax=Paracnuella aquatica TaxID=2268757 RepID=UPI000DEEAC77|nr:heavy metal-binding domain-containing protein [Paracnuella aquatica]RPD43457.1 hypothetical protein DRJ53_19995 [Paracnuella aquatica]
MKKILFMAVAILISSATLLAQTKAGKVDTSQHATFYTCPKHSDVVSHQPGKCSTCGTELTLTTKEEMKTSALKNYTCPVHISVTSHDPGKCPQCGRKMNWSPKEQMKAEVTKLFTCPMHPEVALNKDGICPKCSKPLEERKRAKIKRS